MSKQEFQIPGELIRAIDDAIEFLDSAQPDYGNRQPLEVQSFPSLLEECEQLCIEAAAQDSMLIRTLHHLACTGGTLIAKCLASMPNTQLLSEVDPLNAQAHADSSKFFPTDLVRLAHASTRPADKELLIEIFIRGLAAIHEDTQRKGIRLILRDHAHGQFTFGHRIEERPSLREIVARRFRIKSLVTVRHPLDSYLSLLNNGWARFQPRSIEEYARRYLVFLDHYSDLEIIRYEDFVDEPERTMKRICEVLDLAYNNAFIEVFSAHRLSGDSGRSGEIISARPRRPVPEEIKHELAESCSIEFLCDRLGYQKD